MRPREYLAHRDLPTGPPAVAPNSGRLNNRDPATWKVLLAPAGRYCVPLGVRCGGVLEVGTTLKTINREEYDCGLCAAGYKPTLDEMVEVTFTVSPRVRRIAAGLEDPSAAETLR